MNKKELTIEQLVGYLPYNLKGYSEKKAIKLRTGEFIPQKHTLSVTNVGNLYAEQRLHLVKPRFHPLSDLTKFCKDLGFVPIEKLAESYTAMYSTPPNRIAEERKRFVKDKTLAINCNMTMRLSHWIIKKLYQWHFDIHNLIPDGLAIDINTLNPKP